MNAGNWRQLEAATLMIFSVRAPAELLGATRNHCRLSADCQPILATFECIVVACSRGARLRRYALGCDDEICLQLTICQVTIASRYSVHNKVTAL